MAQRGQSIPAHLIRHEQKDVRLLVAVCCRLAPDCDAKSRQENQKRSLLPEESHRGKAVHTNSILREEADPEYVFLPKYSMIEQVNFGDDKFAFPVIFLGEHLPPVEAFPA
jgi:hypothetical protein